MAGVRFLVLMLTSRCNLSCSYCYAGAGEAGADMSLETARRAISLFTPDKGKLTVEMAGGEPLLNWEMVTELANSCDPDRIRLAIQSNGLLLSGDRIEFLAKRGVGIGLSLDSTPEVNDRLRGGGRHVIKALDLLSDMGLGVNITVVLTSNNLDTLPEFILFLAQKPAVRVVNLDLVRMLGRADKFLQPEPASIRRMVPRLLSTLAFINARRWPPLKVREVEQTLRRRREKPGRAYCLAGEAAYAAVTPGGSIYSCSSLIGRKEFQAGEVAKPDPAGLGSLARANTLPPECARCEALPACRGGCPARRLANQEMKTISSSECALRKALWERLAA